MVSAEEAIQLTNPFKLRTEIILAILLVEEVISLLKIKVDNPILTGGNPVILIGTEPEMIFSSSKIKISRTRLISNRISNANNRISSRCSKGNNKISNVCNKINSGKCSKISGNNRNRSNNNARNDKRSRSEITVRK